MDRTVIAACFTIFLLLLTTGCVNEEDEHVEGSGDLIDLEYDYTGFTKVEFGMGFQLTMTHSVNYSVKLSVDDNVKEFLKVEKDVDTLIITLEEGNSYRDLTLEAVITMPDLESLWAYGGTFATVEDLDLDHDLSLQGNGGSHIVISGSVEDLTIVGDGGANFECEHLSAGDVDVELDGGSHATVNLTGSLTADVDGGSMLEYHGEPTETSISEDGGATVMKAD